MALLRNEDTNVDITTYVSLSTKQEVIRTVQQTLDGNTHIQRIGNPTISYEVSDVTLDHYKFIDCFILKTETSDGEMKYYCQIDNNIVYANIESVFGIKITEPMKEKSHYVYSIYDSLFER